MKQILYIFLLFATSAHAQVTFTAPDVTYNAGQPVEAKATVSGFDAITAFQWALMFDTAALRLDSLAFPGNLPGYEQVTCFSLHSPGYTLQPGEIRSLWSDPYGETLSDGTHVFSMHFTAKQAGKLSQDIAIYPQGLYPVAYSFPLVPQALYWQFIPAKRPAKFAANDRGESAFSVFPNPARGQVTVTLPASGRVRVFDASGRLESETDGAEGVNEITLTGAAGMKVVQYGSETKKIVNQ